MRPSTTETCQIKNTKDPFVLMEAAGPGQNPIDYAIAHGPLTVDKMAAAAVSASYHRASAARMERVSELRLADMHHRTTIDLPGTELAVLAAESTTRHTGLADEFHHQQRAYEAHAAWLKPKKDQLLARHAELLRGTFSRRILPAIAVLSTVSGVATTEAVMHLDGGTSHDASIFSGDSAPGFIPDTIARYMPPGLSDNHMTFTRVDYLPANKTDDTTSTQYEIVVTSDSKAAQAANEYAADFQLQGSEKEADTVAAKQFVEELETAAQNGGTITGIHIVGKASDEAAGENTGISVTNPQNGELALLRAETGEQAYTEALASSSIAPALPHNTIEGVEVTLDTAQGDQLQATAEKLGISVGQLINTYNKNPERLNLDAAAAKTMTELFDQNRGVEYRATVTLPKELLAVDRNTFASPSTKRVEYSHDVLGLGSSGEFMAGLLTVLSAQILLYGAIGTRVHRRIARHRAKLALKAVSQVPEA